MMEKNTLLEDSELSKETTTRQYKPHETAAFVFPIYKHKLKDSQIPEQQDCFLFKLLIENVLTIEIQH